MRKQVEDVGGKTETTTTATKAAAAAAMTTTSAEPAKDGGDNGSAVKGSAGGAASTSLKDAVAPPAQAAPATKAEVAEAIEAALNNQPGVGGGIGPDESILEKFCVDLTTEARHNRLDPLVGRDEELARTIHVLSRRTKNNPCFLGESGVGKTALVDGLAQRIAHGDVPRSLRNARVMSLDHAALTAAGAVAPGEYEALLTALMQEIANIPANKPPVILFIDDIHSIVPAQPGAPDGSAVLKGPLGRGLLRCIGASTPEKFKKTIELDPGLERRFQLVQVGEPTIEEAVSVLRGLRPRYERHHQVGVSEAAIIAAVNLSNRYIDGRYLPDKAIDLVDEAAAAVCIEKNSTTPEVIEKADRKIRQLEREKLQLSLKKNDKEAKYAIEEIIKVLEVEKRNRKDLDSTLGDTFKQKREVEKLRMGLENKRRQILFQKSYHLSMAGMNDDDDDDDVDDDDVDNDDDYEDEEEENGIQSTAAAEASNGDASAAPHANGSTKDKTGAEKASANGKAAANGSNADGSANNDMYDAMMKRLETEKVELEGLLAAAEAKLKVISTDVEESDIAAIVARWTGIPVTKLVASEAAKLLQLQEELHQRIIGQEEAVQKVAEAIQRSRANLADPNGPIASFMFLGPTGVGKTELAKALASHLFSSDSAMIRLDMSEYMEKHSVARLIGAPPGYVGFEEGGLLTDAVRRKPYSVVLFDEIEKAHPDVFNILLQLLDEGRVTDTKGVTVSFRNTLVIMTSNLGSHEISSEHHNNPRRWQQMRDRVMGHVRSYFRPEFYNRLDDFIVFHPLNHDEIRKIVRLHAERVAERLSDRRMKLNLTESAVEFLANAGFDPVYGARPVKRAFQRELLQILAVAVLKGEFEEEDVINVDASNRGLVLTKGKSATATPKGKSNGKSNGKHVDDDDLFLDG